LHGIVSQGLPTIIEAPLVPADGSSFALELDWGEVASWLAAALDPAPPAPDASTDFASWHELSTSQYCPVCGSECEGCTEDKSGRIQPAAGQHWLARTTYTANLRAASSGGWMFASTFFAIARSYLK
jgi:hypothetical protein